MGRRTDGTAIATELGMLERSFEVPVVRQIEVLTRAMEIRPGKSLAMVAQLIDNAARFVGGGYYAAAKGCLGALFSVGESAELVDGLAGDR